MVPENKSAFDVAENPKQEPQEKEPQILNPFQVFPKKSSQLDLFEDSIVNKDSN